MSLHHLPKNQMVSRSASAVSRGVSPLERSESSLMSDSVKLMDGQMCGWQRGSLP